ncbi:hypothetical protein K438DRAFT_1774317 [Mycena galopus ATCC 62051]|nr:hypothetical protein K438DRAFT_1774317 [Mycena galopus ATCC 62051]
MDRLLSDIFVDSRVPALPMSASPAYFCLKLVRAAHIRGITIFCSLGDSRERCYALPCKVYHGQSPSTSNSTSSCPTSTASPPDASWKTFVPARVHALNSPLSRRRATPFDLNASTNHGMPALMPALLLQFSFHFWNPRERIIAERSFDNCGRRMGRALTLDRPSSTLKSVYGDTLRQ